MRGLPVSVKGLIWAALVALVLTAGLVYFPRDYPGMGFWEALYCTVQLFVFNAGADGFPKSWPLVLIYFAAPALSLSAAGTVISYLFRLTPMVRTRWLSDHVVICGLGRTGKILAEALYREGVAVVGIDRQPAEEFAEWRRKVPLPIFHGDFHRRPLLERAGAQRARALVFASGDDLANLEGAIAAYEWLPANDRQPRLIWTHIASERLRSVTRRVVETQGRLAIRFFDTYQIAAVKMLERCFPAERRRAVREVVLIGFGKFGRDLFEHLLRDGPSDASFALRVVDIADREAAVMDLARELGAQDRVSVSRADVHELEFQDSAGRSFFLCTDDDLGNLTAAMELAAKAHTGDVFVRMAQWPLAAITDRLGEGCGVTFVNINQLVREGLAQLPGLFQPAGEDDLKRVKAKPG